MRTPKGRILCTQDDPDSRELIVYILQTADYHVTITADFPEALSLVQCEQFDLILVDNWMPGLSGQELTTEIRKFDKNTHPFLLRCNLRNCQAKGTGCWRSGLSYKAVGHLGSS